jgi:hypothetical protein
MPKDWNLHKAELIQLYSTEGQTLKEVRKLLEERHGFIAS